MNPRQSLESAATNSIYRDISSSPNVYLDIRYGSTNNLLKEDVYGGFQKAFLHYEAAEKFFHACDLLKQKKPNWKFIVFDALRPRSAQIRFWDLVKGTDQQQYFADPAKGSIHNFGFAIDLSLIDEQGKELDMGTEFDDLSELAQPKMELDFLKKGILKQAQINNRLLLREIMTTAGFEQLAHEWWHYDALPGAVVRSQYPILE